MSPLRRCISRPLAEDFSFALAVAVTPAAILSQVHRLFKTGGFDASSLVNLLVPGLAGMVLSFAHTLGEFGVVLMVGGNIPGVTQTISIAIYDDVEALDYARANHTSLVLLIFSFVVLSITYSLNRKIWAVWPLRRDDAIAAPPAAE